jgi:hypothetical protein
MSQYGGTRSLENQGPHGGWLASAVDLVCYASAFDDRNTCPILSPTSVDKLFATHPYGTNDSPPGYYGCGWYVMPSGSRTGQSHGGKFEGTKTQLWRWQDGADSFCGALLINKLDDDAGWDLSDLIRDTADTITTWPSSGFMESYL